MKEKTKTILGSVVLVIVLGVILFMVVSGIMKQFDINTQQQEGYSCYERVCVRYTLDEFEKCIDIGIEDLGFMSSEHYYVCDGVKVTKNCVEYENVKTNRTKIGLGMWCEKDEEE